MNDAEREQWVNNDEGLYDWYRGWRRGRLGVRSVRAFVREHRSELDACIQRMLSGEKRAHYLKYG